MQVTAVRPKRTQSWRVERDKSEDVEKPKKTLKMSIVSAVLHNLLHVYEDKYMNYAVQNKSTT